MNVLFVCSRNRLRSPTAERIFSTVPGWRTLSAGTASDAECVVDGDLVEWADLIVVMEHRHQRRLRSQFPNRALPVVVLNILDHYEAMDPDLIALLQERMAPWLPHAFKARSTQV